jgi:hypothetical protein
MTPIRLGLVLSVLGLSSAWGAADWPRFRTQEIANDLTIGYAVLVTDIDGDQKPDIVVVDKHRVIWYQNPTWQVRTILQGQTKPDNVCITDLDITGDGLPELVLGAGWKPTDTTTPGTFHWLRRGKSLDDEWTMVPIPCDEPTVHRVRAIDIDADGKPEIVSVPLQGRDCTAKGNWTDGRPVRITAYTVPDQPEQPQNWKPIVLSDSLYVCHNFTALPPGGFARPGRPLAVVSYDGIHFIYPEGPADRWTTIRVHPANQDNPKGSRGASEIKTSYAGGRSLIATIEPWHGHQVVVYTPGKPHPADGPFSYERHVIDDQLRWGHALAFADLNGDGSDELIVGVRDDPNPKLGDTFSDRKGVRLYKATDAKGSTWERFLLDAGGVAVEDLTVADFNGDGRPDIVAVGRATGNCRIYWNEGTSPDR